MLSMSSITRKPFSPLPVTKLVRVGPWNLSFEPYRPVQKLCFGVTIRNQYTLCGGLASLRGRAFLPKHGSLNTPQQLAVYDGWISASKRLALANFLSTSPSQGQGDDKHTVTVNSKEEQSNHAPHFKRTLLEKKTDEETNEDDNVQYLLPHPIWSESEIHSVEITHKKPDGFVDWYAYSCVQMLRFSFDVLSGYNRGVRTEEKWLIRIIFLETIAGVPGMVAAMSRHLRSLRRLQRDHGWIHTLLEEAENERMHLMTALELKKPSRLFTYGVLISQGIFVNMFFLAYLCSPRFCHRVVGYLEEEAVITYTKLIKDLDDGKLSIWKNMAAPDLAIRYWKLKPDAQMRDMILAIRADEAHHREVNHSLSDLKSDDSNPFPPGQ